MATQLTLKQCTLEYLGKFGGFLHAQFNYKAQYCPFCKNTHRASGYFQRWYNEVEKKNEYIKYNTTCHGKGSILTNPFDPTESAMTFSLQEVIAKLRENLEYGCEVHVLIHHITKEQLCISHS